MRSPEEKRVVNECKRKLAKMMSETSINGTDEEMTLISSWDKRITQMRKNEVNSFDIFIMGFLLGEAYTTPTIESQKKLTDLLNLVKEK